MAELVLRFATLALVLGGLAVANTQTASAAGTCYYTQDHYTTYNNVCADGSRHYNNNIIGGYYYWNFAPRAWSYGTSRQTACFVNEVLWGTFVY